MEGKKYEARLLRHTLLSGSTPLSPTPTPIECTTPLSQALSHVVTLVEEGKYLEALAHPSLQSLLWNPHLHFYPDPDTDPDAFYEKVRLCARSFVSSSPCEDVDADADEKDKDTPQNREILVMAVGIAALLAFVQANITGPPLSPNVFPLAFLSTKSQNFTKEWDSWARLQLMVDGCDLLGTCSLPQYLIFAKLLLVGTKEIKASADCHHLATRMWWMFRTFLAHQKVLAESSQSLYEALSLSSTNMLKLFGNKESFSNSCCELDTAGGDLSNLTAAVHLEIGLAEYMYGHVDKARKHFSDAAEAVGIELSLTGALGFRTIHQIDPKAQMVLVVNQSLADTNFSQNESVGEGDKQKLIGDDDSSDILMVPRLLENSADEIPSIEKSTSAKESCLSAIQQAVVLAYCHDVKKSNPDDELRGWQMAPFIEAVDRQQYSCFMVRCCCQLLRVRWECSRNRTLQRALLIMEDLVEKIRGCSLDVGERMCFVFCVHFPTVSAVLKEYAGVMVRCGLVGEALRIFEELELWDNLIDCYCLLGKKAIAIDLIRQRLQHQPSNPRLWCCLGDITIDDGCYVKAWELSGHHFARAQRSLARSSYNRGEYKKSLEHWVAAVKLNPLHPGAWFALGSAALKAREMNDAIEGFTHAVQLDPDNGEAWNNIAAIHMTMKRSKEACIAFREALKFRRNSWQMWENYAQVSLDIGSFGQAVEALQMVVDLSKGKRVDIPSFSKLLNHIELGKGVSLKDLSELGRDNEYNKTEEGSTSPKVSQRSHDTIFVESKELEWLVDSVGKLLRQISKYGEGGSDIWSLLARWDYVMGDLTVCSEALLKQVRSLQGQGWQQNEKMFSKFADASIQLCEIYRKMASTNAGSKRELSTAQMHLRNTIKQSERFVNTLEYAALQSCLEEIQSQLQQLPSTKFGKPT